VAEQKQRRRRADGEQSRGKILDATVEIAGERGYEGTSIALVSARSGLPASSIYWHFKDKDDLIAAVIERSFGTWLDAVTAAVTRGPDSSRERWIALVGDIAKALLETPDFLRLGLMLALERRPEEPSARRMFLQVRDTAYARVEQFFHELLPRLDDAGVRLLATYAMAGADGLFIAREIGGDSVDLLALFRLHAEVIYDAAVRLGAEAS
jgi:AcrR family transcriptional regulator